MGLIPVRLVTSDISASAFSSPTRTRRMISNRSQACEHVIDYDGLKTSLLHNSDSEPSETCRTKCSHSQCQHHSAPPGSQCSFETACPVLPGPLHLRQFKRWPAVPEKFFSTSFSPITESCNLWNPHPRSWSSPPLSPEKRRRSPHFIPQPHQEKPPAATARLYTYILSVIGSVHRALTLPAEMATFYDHPPFHRPSPRVHCKSTCRSRTAPSKYFTAMCPSGMQSTKICIAAKPNGPSHLVENNTFDSPSNKPTESVRTRLGFLPSRFSAYQ
ncbi:uncharacterized protein LY79DRAFT_287373 [Colletotrichum navitas]|uniref:Uncharacterized protein n=1 Tax=Colletotrichum navitas TaxID=681940 RepID=A0AAD8Q9G3_9PEZI|nr:uncharacterized protein LY79DRAFT_287373 [Colletotrichum navitas]KAK1598380.1 hypothetical protein LY79DRAFT_287373 [Colletotrichum navitas]